MHEPIESELQASLYEAPVMLALFEKPGLVEQFDVSHELFSDPLHQRIVKAIRDLQSDCVQTDPYAIVERACRGTREIPPELVAELLTKIRNGFSAAEILVPGYIKRLEEAARRRRLLQRLRDAEAIVRDPLADLGEAFELLNDADYAPSSRLRLLDSAAFDDTRFEVEPLINNVLMRGQMAGIVAMMKGCKTLLSTSIGVYGGFGQPWLGYDRFSIPRPFRTWIISMESGGGTLQAYARSMAHSIGYRLHDLDDRLLWGLECLKLSDAAVLTAIRREVERRGIDVLIIDPTYLALDVGEGDESSIYRMGRRFQQVAKMAADTGLTIILVHHSVKRRENPFAPMQLHEASGAGFAEFLRQWILLSRMSQYDPERHGYHELAMTAGGSAGHSGCFALTVNEFSEWGTQREWRVEVRPYSEAKRERVEASEEQKLVKKEAREKAAADAAIKKFVPKVIELLRRPENQKGASANKIRNGISCTPSSWRRVFAYLQEGKHITPCVYIALNHKPTEGWQLTDFKEQQDALGLQADASLPSGCSQDDAQQQDALSHLGSRPSVVCLRDGEEPTPQSIKVA